jgi:hypothetical protein
VCAIVGLLTTARIQVSRFFRNTAFAFFFDMRDVLYQHGIDCLYRSGILNLIGTAATQDGLGQIWLQRKAHMRTNEMSRLEQAQDIAQRAAQAEYQRELKECIEAGMDETEAKEWASDNASSAYDKAFDEACEVIGA